MGNFFSEFISGHPRLAGGLLLVCLLLAGNYVFSLGSSAHQGFARPQGNVDYVDEVTGEVSLRPEGDLPPQPGKDGQMTLVRAHYLTRPDQTRVLDFLEKYTPEAKAIVTRIRRGAAITPDEMAAAQAGWLVRKPEPAAPWVPGLSPAGRAIVHPLPGGNDPAK